MFRTVGRRLAHFALVFLAVSFVTFALVRLAPGNEAVSILEKRGVVPSPAAISAERRSLGLDGSLPSEYLHWLINALHGNLGISAQYNQPVSTQLVQRLGATCELMALGALLMVILGLGSAVASALTGSAVVRSLVRGLGLLSLSLPAFAVGYAGVLVFALWLGWLPAEGQDGIRGVILPAVVLALPFAGALSRLMVAAMTSTLQEPYILTARARGLSQTRTVIRHALPNVAVTGLIAGGTLLGQLVASTLVVEAIFAWPGIGSYFIAAVGFRDIPALEGSVLVIAGMALFARELGATLAAMIDPRAGSQ